MNRGALIRLGIGAVALIVAVAGYTIWFGIVTNANVQAAALASEIATDSVRATRVAAAKSALAALASDESAVGQYFVSSATLVPFLESIQNTAAQLHASTTITSVAAQTKSGRSSLSVNGTIIGSFDEVSRAVGAIEYAPYYVTLDQLSLTSDRTPGAPSGAAPVVWTANFALTVGSQAPVTSMPPPLTGGGSSPPAP